LVDEQRIIFLTDKYFLFIVVLDAVETKGFYTALFFLEKNLTTYNHSFIASLKEVVQKIIFQKRI
jgi:hypothetical protein